MKSSSRFKNLAEFKKKSSRYSLPKPSYDSFKVGNKICFVDEGVDKKKEVLYFHEMDYIEVATLFGMHSPHLVPIIKRVRGFVKHEVIICKKHQTPLIVIEEEVQPCLKCQAKKLEK